MKFVGWKVCFFILVLLLVQSGCENNGSEKLVTAKREQLAESEHSGYLPKEVEILSLTEYIENSAEGSVISIFVSLSDQFDSQIKSPGIFRFEMYERIKYSAEPRGKRIRIWDDLVLTDAEANNRYWRDFLRAYQFNLPFESANGRDYIIEVTYLNAENERLSDAYVLGVGQ